jgi:hypothetical protein
VAFAYVFDEFLIVPVGQVFGSRNAPSFYCVLADLREVLAICREDVEVVELHDLVKKCSITIQPSADSIIGAARLSSSSSHFGRIVTQLQCELCR